MTAAVERSSSEVDNEPVAPNDGSDTSKFLVSDTVPAQLCTTLLGPPHNVPSNSCFNNLGLSQVAVSVFLL